MLLVTGKQAGKIDEYTQNKIGIPGLVLMERAALAVAEKVKHLIGEGAVSRRSGAVLAVAGIGNNGADAVAAARLLSVDGISARAVIVGSSDRFSESMVTQINIARNLGIELQFIENAEDCDALTFDADIILDGLFGVGLTRDITGIYSDIIDKVNEADSYRIAIDVPSGIDAGTGHILGNAVSCDETVTFQYMKYGLLLDEGRDYAGSVLVQDIGLADERAIDKLEESFVSAALEDDFILRALEETDMLKLLPRRNPNANKGTFGKVLVVAGNDDIYGAAYLTAAAALRMGAGLVRVYTSPLNISHLKDAMPELLLEDYDKDESLDRLKEGIKWADVIAAGPGIGTGEGAVRAMICLAEAEDTEGKLLVLDADALNICSEEPNILRQLSSKYKGVVITPHILEAARLIEGVENAGLHNINKMVADIKHNRLRYVRRLADEYNAVTVLKDARTHIASPCGREIYVNTTGNSAMAKGGSGDVLTGIVAAILAEDRINIPDEAGIEYIRTLTALGVYIHGMAGDIARGIHGEYSTLASHIVDAIENIV